MATQELTHTQKHRIEEILRSLDQTPPGAAVTNRRGSARVNARLTITTHLLSVAGHPTMSVHSRNISTSGIGLMSRRPFRKGEYMAVELFVLPKFAKLVLCEVTFNRYVRDGIYEVGCSFREAITREEFMNSIEPIPQRWITTALPPAHHNFN